MPEEYVAASLRQADNASLVGHKSWFGPRIRHLTYYCTHQNQDIDTFMWQRFPDPTLVLHGG